MYKPMIGPCLGLLLWLAACGQPTVTYEVDAEGALAENVAEIKACLTKCDAKRRGVGCSGDNESLEITASPCNVDCFDEVKQLVQEGCIPETLAVWACEATATWTCDNPLAPPTPVIPTACAVEKQVVKNCQAPPPPDALDIACDQRCEAGATACLQDEPAFECAKTCKDDLALSKDLCKPHAKELLECQTASVTCDGGVIA